MAYRVSIMGASGYGGSEAARILARHSGVRLMHLSAESQAGRPLADLYPNLRSVVDAVTEPGDAEAIARDSDAVIVSLPSGLSMTQVPALLAGGAKVVDVGADFRFRDAAAWERSYKKPHAAPELLAEAVYGLPEVNRAGIASSRLVANPGCYAVAALIALAPLVRSGSVRRSGIVIDAKSGVSGAGRGNASAMGFSELNENVRPYSVIGHGHTGEIEQELSRAAGEAVSATFTPHLIPMTRGILVTCYAPLAYDLGEAEASELYREAYRREPFVRVLGDALPETKATLGSNFCDVAVRVDRDRGIAIAIATLDNLVKGAAGNAVQNLNLMLGLPETMGLDAPGLYP